MTKPGKTGLTRIIDATRYSLKGLRSAWAHEAAFRQETALTLVLTPIAFLVADSRNPIPMQFSRQSISSSVTRCLRHGSLFSSDSPCVAVSESARRSSVAPSLRVAGSCAV